MFQLLDLDYELDLDEMLNISSRTNEILERFDTIADALNQTTNGFLHKNHLDKLEAMKGLVFYFNLVKNTCILFSEGKWKTINFDSFFNAARLSYSSLPMETLILKINQTIKGLREDSTPMDELEKVTITVKLKEHE